MKDSERKELSNCLDLLRHFPGGSGGKRRNEFLRVRYLDNRKIFFGVFFKKQKTYSLVDRKRGFPLILHLPEIFKSIIPKSLDNGKYEIIAVVGKDGYRVILKEVSTRKQKRLHLLSIYPA